MKTKPIIVLAIAIIALIASPARSKTLGSTELTGWCEQWANIPVNSIQFALKNLDDDSFRLNIANASEDDIGRTFTVTSGSTEFSKTVSYLTNGLDDHLALLSLGPDGSGPGRTFYESSIQKLYGNGPDFAGFEIKSISLTINNLTLDYPIPSDEGWNWNEMDYNVTLSFNDVPEPATLFLLGLGGLALLRNRRK